MDDTTNQKMVTSLIKPIKNSVPSILTLMNLLSGCLAILLSFHDVALAAVMILLAGLFDFIDGLAARILDAYSDFGKELDSLADIVSFGVAPSFIMYHLISGAIIAKNPLFSPVLFTGEEAMLIASAFLPAIFAAIRLAKFNLEEGKDGVFSGLPSPAAGIFIASAGYILGTTDSIWIRDLLMNTRILLLMSAGMSLLMVVPVPMFNIKFRNLRFADNKIRYLFTVPSAITLFYLGIKAIPIVISWYILLSVLLVITSRYLTDIRPGRT